MLEVGKTYLTKGGISAFVVTKMFYPVVGKIFFTVKLENSSYLFTYTSYGKYARHNYNDYEENDIVLYRKYK